MKAILLGLLFISMNAYSTSFVGVHTDMFAGDEENSLTGNYGYGIIFSSYTDNNGPLKFMMGTSFSYSSAVGYIDSEEYDMTMYGGDLHLGFNFSPFSKNYISPNFEISAMGGMRSIEVLSPPEGEEAKTLTTASGYKASLAIDFGKNPRSKFRVSADYCKRTAGNVAGVASYNLDSLSFGIGFSF